MKQTSMEADPADQGRLGPGVPSWFRRGLGLIHACMLACCLLCGPSHADSFSEVDVRAVYLFNFAVFIDWPASAFESAVSPMRYCVAGAQVLRASLERVLENERVAGRELNLVEPSDSGDWRRCHLLYLGRGLEASEPRILAAVKGAPVLTVGESESFVHDGGIIALVRRGDRLRALIDPKAAEKVGIRISSKLLRLSRIHADVENRQ